MPQQRTYKNQFDADYAVPTAIMRLVDTGQLTDMSWHDDVCPSFCPADVKDDSIRLWVDHPDPQQRELGGKRYKIALYNEMGQSHGYALETDSLLALIRYLADHHNITVT